jgi:8-oxo-dGTP pyrophosphatase MutT (NUDIX family)
MTYPVRQTVRVVLLNHRDELLLMCTDDPRIGGIGENYKGRFWTLIGGQIEGGETILKAAAREVFEETGIAKENIEFGPVVWFEELDLVLRDGPTHIRHQFIVGRTRESRVTLAHLTEDEPEVVKRLAWFFLEQIVNSTETIYPLLLPSFVPPIIAMEYPEQPLDIGSQGQAEKPQSRMGS